MQRNINVGFEVEVTLRCIPAATRTVMKADQYLSETVYNLPAQFVFQPGGQLREKVARAVSMSAAKVIAGPTECHLVLNIKWPYYKGVR
jgi:hypothetical protein